MNGIIVVNKPKGITSRDVVNKISRILKIKKVGHNGTLDPLATGVLIITIGKYTKLNNMLSSKEKEYIAEVKLGIKTDSLDISGEILDENNKKLDLSLLKKTLKKYEKSYMQEVPKYSAVKVNGKKLYEYARSNIEVKLPKKLVTIKSLQLLSHTYDKFTFKCKVSKGTYIRSLIRDIMDDMNMYGVMSNLTRVKQGPFDISESYTLEDIEKNNYKILKIKDIVDIKTIKVDGEDKKKIKNGCRIKGNYPYKVLFVDNDNEELAIYKKDGNIMKVEVML